MEQWQLSFYRFLTKYLEHSSCTDAVLMPFRSVLCSFQGSPSEDRNFRSDVDDIETEEASFSGQDDSDLIDILEWAKVQKKLSPWMYLDMISKLFFMRICTLTLTVIKFPTFLGKQSWIIADNK